MKTTAWRNRKNDRTKSPIIRSIINLYNGIRTSLCHDVYLWIYLWRNRFCIRANQYIATKDDSIDADAHVAAATRTVNVLCGVYSFFDVSGLWEETLGNGDDVTRVRSEMKKRRKREMYEERRAKMYRGRQPGALLFLADNMLISLLIYAYANGFRTIE